MRKGTWKYGSLNARAKPGCPEWLVKVGASQSIPSKSLTQSQKFAFKGTPQFSKKPLSFHKPCRSPSFSGESIDTVTDWVFRGVKLEVAARVDPLWYRCPEYHPLRVPELASQHGDCPPAGATRAGVGKTKRNGGLHWKGSPHSGSFRPLLPCVSAAGEVGVILGCGKLRSPSHRTAPLRQVSIPNSANSLGLLGNPSFPGSYPVPGSGRTNGLDRLLPSPDSPHLRPQGHPAAHFFKGLPLSSLFWSCSVLFYHSLPPEAAPKAPSCLDPPPILLA